jgi:hypothetical protein
VFLAKKASIVANRCERSSCGNFSIINVNHNYLEEISRDQDFGNAKVYLSNDFEYAIGFIEILY